MVSGFNGLRVDCASVTGLSSGNRCACVPALMQSSLRMLLPSAAASAGPAAAGGSESDLDELDLVDDAAPIVGTVAADEQTGSEPGDALPVDEQPPALDEPPARDDPLVQLVMRQQEARCGWCREGACSNPGVVCLQACVPAAVVSSCLLHLLPHAG